MTMALGPGSTPLRLRRWDPHHPDVDLASGNLRLSF
jgi:hypothetical protein